MRVLFLLLLCAVSYQAQVKGCKTDYDKFKDVTHYHCYGILKQGFISFMNVSVSVRETGNAAFQFSTVRSDLRFLRNREMTLLLDETDRYTIAVSDTDARATYLGNLSQSLIFQVSREMLETIAAAKKVEVKIGSAEGKLDDGLLKKLKAAVEFVAKSK